MRVRLLGVLIAAGLLSPLAAQAQYAVQDSAAGAAAGGAVAGPVGAAAGAIVGGTVGAAGDILSPPAPVVTYVEKSDIPSVAVEDEVVVGRPLPKTVIVHRVPKYHYEYAVVNHERVIIEPRTRKVVKIIKEED